MRLIKLVHPVLGLCAQQVILGLQNERKITNDWKHKYGKKFFECIIEFESDEKKPVPKIVDIKVKTPLPYTKITDKIIQKVLKLAHEGYKSKYISQTVRISISTVNRIRKNKKDTGNTYYTINGQKLIA